MAAAMGSILATGSMVTMILETIHAMAIMHVHICTVRAIVLIVSADLVTDYSNSSLTMRALPQKNSFFS